MNTKWGKAPSKKNLLLQAESTEVWNAYKYILNCQAKFFMVFEMVWLCE